MPTLKKRMFLTVHHINIISEILQTYLIREQFLCILLTLHLCFHYFLNPSLF